MAFLSPETLDRVNRYLRIEDGGMTYNNHRRTVVISFAPIVDRENYLAEVTIRLYTATQFVINLFRALQHNPLTAHFMWTMSVEISGPFGQVLVNNYGGMRNYAVHRRFLNIHDIALNLIRSILETLETLQQSERDGMDHVDPMNDLVYTFYYDARAEDVYGRGVMRKIIAKTIRENPHAKGLAKYPVIHGLCGYQAIIYVLSINEDLRNCWQGDLSWFYNCFTMNTLVPLAQQLRDSKTRFQRLANQLKHYIGGNESVWQVSRVDELSTAQKFIAKQSNFRLVVFNEATRQIMENRTGLNFGNNPDMYDDRMTILFNYTLGHVQLVKSMYSYFGKTFQSGSAYCFDCGMFCRIQHKCKGLLTCQYCITPFRTKTAYDAHLGKSKTGFLCGVCNVLCPSQKCFDNHTCRAPRGPCGYCQTMHENGSCGITTCRRCSKRYQKSPVGEFIPHECFIERLEEKSQLCPRIVCENYYAFDVESRLDLTDPETGACKHTVNLIVVKRCFSQDPPMIFSDLDMLIRWIESLTIPVELFAHNMSGYDGRLVFDHLFENYTAPQEMLWKGSKILSMTYGKATFRDTLPHLTTSLEKLPAMFGLDENRYKKGFFPYRFNTVDNQDYIDQIPDKQYFDPDNMSGQKKLKFEQWYDERSQTLYNFHQEMVEYCISDVEILANSIEAYVTTMMKIKPMNPLASITIASYAMKLYRTYFIPPNTIANLTIREHNDIKPAMHGGRTDTRCLLYEFSEEELANGIHGAYQDVQSLYPTVQFYDPLPVGKPRHRQFDPLTQPSIEEVRAVFGYICCDIRPTVYLHHPVIVNVDKNQRGGRLLATLEPLEKKVVTSPELQLALDHGYVIDRVYWWYDFDQSTGLFKDYVRTFLKGKVESGGWKQAFNDPTVWDSFCNYHQDELGIDLTKERFTNNPAYRSCMKLLLNSLWGKFGERSVKSHWLQTTTGKENGEMYGLENKWFNGEIDINFRKYSKDGKTLGIIYTPLAPTERAFQVLPDHSNIALAGFVTAHARCRLWKMLHKIGTRVLYHDTDSIIYKTAGINRESEDIPRGKYLGDWEDELPGRKIVKFVSPGPKCYSYITDDGTGCVKIKGFTLTTSTTALINYNSMASLVRKETITINASNLLFRHNRNLGEMITKMTSKIFKVTYNKAYIGRDYFTYPFGWENFQFLGKENVYNPEAEEDVEADDDWLISLLISST